jgi:dTDP-4-amino-4,6-dideoxygalactose transaminase
MSFDTLFKFEEELSKYTGAPYVIVTDGCTHALELCFRYDHITQTTLTPYTYLSIPMMLNQLGIKYEYYPDTLPHRQQWIGEYKFEATRIWDSARRLERDMYQPGMLQCLSFGNGKPLQLGKCGAILTDDQDAYNTLSKMRSDGRDLRISPWQEQKSFSQGYHYCPTLETCVLGIGKLHSINQEPKYYQYPDLRTIDIS